MSNDNNGFNVTAVRVSGSNPPPEYWHRIEAMKAALTLMGPDRGLDDLIAMAEWLLTGDMAAAMRITEQTRDLYRDTQS